MRIHRTMAAALGVLALVALAATPAAGTVFVKNNNLGVNTSNPTAPLHVAGPDQVRFLFQQTTAPSARWDFKINANGFFNILLVGGVPQPEMALLPANDGIGTLRVVGPVQASAFNIGSSRSFKENFAPLDPSEVLAKVVELPISRYNFKADPDTPHVGPMAEDFYAAFGLGAGDKHIALNDLSGVALSAIQALNAQVEKRDQVIEQLLKRVSQLEQQLNGD
jgi:hypothetical protein